MKLPKIKDLPEVPEIVKRTIIFLFLLVGVDMTDINSRRTAYSFLKVFGYGTLVLVVFWIIGLIFNWIYGITGIPAAATTTVGGIFTVIGAAVGYILYVLFEYTKKQWKQSGRLI